MTCGRVNSVCIQDLATAYSDRGASRVLSQHSLGSCLKDRKENELN